MKRILTTLSLMVLCAALTACTANANDLPMTTTGAPTTTVTQAPTDVMNTSLPDPIDDLLPDPMTSEDPEVTGVTTVSTARRAIEQIEDDLERLSEVSDAEVVLAGNSAAVALKFDKQYKGGVDDRLREIVKERISSVISGVTNIAVTDDKTLMDQLEALGERLESASDIADIQNDLSEIISEMNKA